MVRVNPRRLGVLVAVGMLGAPLAGVQGTALAKQKHGHAQSGVTHPGVMLGAFTNQGWPVLFRVTADRALIVRAQIVFDEKCSDGSTAFGIGSGDMALTVRSGAFSDSFSGGPTVLPDGKTLRYSDQVRGRFNKSGTQITGTWHELTTLTDPSTGASVSCDSGIVSFIAVD